VSKPHPSKQCSLDEIEVLFGPRIWSFCPLRSEGACELQYLEVVKSDIFATSNPLKSLERENSNFLFSQYPCQPGKVVETFEADGR
jgi:hypothetical protein